MSKTDKRQEIMLAALELLAEQGFHGAPMAQIASQAGVAAGTIYCYFESRDVLIRELYRDIEGRINTRIEEGAAADRPTRHRFEHVCRVLLDYFIQHPLEFRYIEQFHNSPYGTEHRRDKLLGRNGEAQLCRELFEQGITEGVIKELPLVILYALTFGPLVILARDHILGFVVLDEEMIARVVEACWDGVKR